MPNSCRNAPGPSLASPRHAHTLHVKALGALISQTKDEASLREQAAQARFVVSDCLTSVGGFPAVVGFNLANLRNRGLRTALCLAVLVWAGVGAFFYYVVK